LVCQQFHESTGNNHTKALVAANLTTTFRCLAVTMGVRKPSGLGFIAVGHPGDRPLCPFKVSRIGAISPPVVGQAAVQKSRGC
jgi:hypothetical protein